jgi:quinol monooxygenase YgiN
MADLQVVAVITAKAGSERLVGDALQALAESARSDQGSIAFDLFTTTTDPATFVAIETWRSQRDLDAHLNSPRVRQAFEAASDHLAQAPAIYPLSIFSVQV